MNGYTVLELGKKEFNPLMVFWYIYGLREFNLESEARNES